MRSFLLRVAFVPLLALAGGCSLLVGSQTECAADTDCAEGAVCREGLCVRPLPPWADGGYWIDAGSTVVDAGKEPDAGEPQDAGEEPDAGELVDAGEDIDAGEPTDAGEEPDAGGPADAGAPADAGQAADAGETPDAGPAVCPATPDCSKTECRGVLCAPGAHCSQGQCLRDGTNCKIDQTTGQSMCDDATCVRASCGDGLGECTALNECTHRAKPGCTLDRQTGFASCSDSDCKGASCGDDQVCAGATCTACGTPCGNAMPGCTNGIDCHTGECTASCACLGTSLDFWCGDGCVRLVDDREHCGACGHACLSGSSCTGGCCGDPTDCEYLVTSSCSTSGYACVEEDGARRASETTCSDAVDNDADGKTDCDDPDCTGKACGSGGCEACTAPQDGVGTCTALLGDGQAGIGCGSYLCDGVNVACPTSCVSDADCASGTSGTPGSCSAGVCQ